MFIRSRRLGGTVDDRGGARQSVQTITTWAAAGLFALAVGLERVVAHDGVPSLLSVSVVVAGASAMIAAALMVRDRLRHGRRTR